MAPASGTVIEARGVTKRYGATTVLDGLDFSVGPGITALLGANGAGKTTFIRLALGLLQADEGTLTVAGIDPRRDGPRARERIGYAPEHHDLPLDLSAVDFVRHLAEMHGIPAREATNRASDLLWLVGLGEERLRPIGTFSTGQRQRVKLAAAVAHDPLLVLLDEPTDGLDPNQRDAMLALIRRVGTEFGMTVLLSSHLLEEVERICDQVVILSGGKAAAVGTLDELRGRQGGLVVELDDGPDIIAQVTAALRALGMAVEPYERALLVSGTSGQADGFVALAVRDALADAGASLRRLQARRTTLEDVFLTVGGR